MFGKRSSRPVKLDRSQYKDVWNSVSADEVDAKTAVSGYSDEETYRQQGLFSAEMLKRLVDIKPDDVVLEIGAGVGRVGAVLAPICKEWIGADVSENMVGHMRRRLSQFPNVRTVALSGYDLAPIESESVDLVYCHVVFMHLDEWDRYAYVKEGFRVLRPGGRMLVDNVNILSDAGWAFFMEHCALKPEDRPPNISKTSTPQELEIYFTRAGFSQIQQEDKDLWIITFGTKA